MGGRKEDHGHRHPETEEHIRLGQAGLHQDVERGQLNKTAQQTDPAPVPPRAEPRHHSAVPTAASTLGNPTHPFRLTATEGHAEGNQPVGKGGLCVLGWPIVRGMSQSPVITISRAGWAKLAS